jgi:hypothetical protein
MVAKRKVKPPLGNAVDVKLCHKGDLDSGDDNGTSGISHACKHAEDGYCGDDAQSICDGTTARDWTVPRGSTASPSMRSRGWSQPGGSPRVPKKFSKECTIDDFASLTYPDLDSFGTVCGVAREREPVTGARCVGRRPMSAVGKSGLNADDEFEAVYDPIRILPRLQRRTAVSAPRALP